MASSYKTTRSYTLADLYEQGRADGDWLPRASNAGASSGTTKITFY